MRYDEWKTTPPDTDECVADDLGAENCPCAECRKWLDSREPRDLDWEPAPSATFEAEQQAAWRRLK